MDRAVQSELEITGSVTTELQLMALRWALSNRTTRQIDNILHWEAGRKIERDRISVESQKQEGEKNSLSEKKTEGEIIQEVRKQEEEERNPISWTSKDRRHFNNERKTELEIPAQSQSKHDQNSQIRWNY